MRGRRRTLSRSRARGSLAKTHALPNVVEKDYVFGWLLADINAHDDFSERYIFEGGTCLKNVIRDISLLRRPRF